MANPPSWDAPDLRARNEPARTARYRRLQSWWREVQLGVPPGDGPDGQPLGSRLRASDVAKQPDLNFLHPDAYAHAVERMAEVPGEDGSLDPVRLQTNLLSSMPLAFNLFGALRNEPGFLPLFQLLFDQRAVAITDVICEWAPRPREDFLGDRTAFDAVVFYRRDGDGTRLDVPAFCGIEVKYTEPFSQKAYGSDRYTEVTSESGWFEGPAGAASRLKAPVANQLWRNTLLAAALDAQGDKGRGMVAVVSLSDDGGARRAYDAVSDELAWHHADRLVKVDLETIVDAVPWVAADLQGWADRFRRRYLDPTLPDRPDQAPDPAGPRFGQELTRP